MCLTIAVNFLFLILAAVAAQGQGVVATLPVGHGPAAVAANPVTNKIYVANSGFGGFYSFTNAGNVTVIDGLTNSAITVTDPNALHPSALTVNPATNKIYVVNGGAFHGYDSSDNVTVIDGATDSTTTVTDPNASGPDAVAVNPITNKIYVANINSNNVTVIDGATNAASTVTDPNVMGPVAVVVNPITNMIYVANEGDSNGNLGGVTVIDGATNSTTTVTDPNASGPDAVAVNPITDKIYVGNHASNNVTVIDGATNSTTTVPLPPPLNLINFGPVAVAVNPVTNKIYVINEGSFGGGPSTAYLGDVTVIDGATNSTNTISPYDDGRGAVAVNTVTNKIYVANAGYHPPYNPANRGSLTVIDGATNFNTTVTDPNADGPGAVAVNPITNRIYAANFYTDNVTVIDGAIVPAPFLVVSPTSLIFAGQNLGTTSHQIVNLTNHGGAPIALTDVAATGDFSAFKLLCPQSIKPRGSCKINVVFKPTQTGLRTGMLNISYNQPGSPQVLGLTGTGTAAAVSLSAARLSFAGQLVGTSSMAQTVMLTNSGDGPLTISGITASGDFTSTTGQCSGTVAVGVSCEIAVVFNPQAGGSRTGSLNIADDASDSPQTVELSGTGQDFAVSASTTSATVMAGQTASYTLSLASEGGFSGAVSFTCAGAPATTTCSPTPSTVTLAASGTTAVTVRVTTTAHSIALPAGRRHPPGLGSPGVLLLFTLLIALGMLAWMRPGLATTRRGLLWVPLSAALLFVTLWLGCGGGTSGPPPVTGTHAGTYPLTVTASGSGLTKNVSLTLFVN